MELILEFEKIEEDWEKNEEFRNEALCVFVGNRRSMHMHSSTWSKIFHFQGTFTILDKIKFYFVFIQIILFSF